MSRIANHGTRSEYLTYKCRCSPCKEASREYMKKNADRRKALGLPVGNKKYLRGTCRNNGCGKEVWSVKKDAIYCSNSCSQTDSLRMARESNRQWRTKGWEKKQLIVFEGDRSTPPVRIISHNWNGRKFYQGRCHQCGITYTTLSSIAPKYCSKRCGSQAYHVLHGLRNTWISKKDRRQIYERDGYRCQICFKLVRTPYDMNDPLSATIDHIVPRTLWPSRAEGLHDPFNLRTSCALCNTTRNNRLDSEAIVPILVITGYLSVEVGRIYRELKATS